MFIFDPPHLIIMSIPYDNAFRMLNVGTVTYMYISDVQRLVRPLYEMQFGLRIFWDQMTKFILFMSPQPFCKLIHGQSFYNKINKDK